MSRALFGLGKVTADRSTTSLLATGYWLLAIALVAIDVRLHFTSVSILYERR